jgi:hypothetical protein
VPCLPKGDLQADRGHYYLPKVDNVVDPDQLQSPFMAGIRLPCNVLTRAPDPKLRSCFGTFSVLQKEVPVPS